MSVVSLLVSPNIKVRCGASSNHESLLVSLFWLPRRITAKACDCWHGSHTHIWSQSVIQMTHWHCLEQRGTLIETNCPVSLHSVNSASRGGGSGYTKIIPKQTFYGTEEYQPKDFTKAYLKSDKTWNENQEDPERRWPKKAAKTGSK